VSDKIWWYLARSSGIVAWLLLAAALIWGLLLSTRILQDRRRPAWLNDLHRWLGGLAVTFTALHLLGLWADDYVEFGWADMVIPGRSEWRPVAVAWGVLSLYLLVAVQLSSLFMRRLPRRVWKGIHYASYPLFWMATVHGGAAGTDTGSRLYRWTVVVTVVAVVFVVTYRVVAPSRAARRRAQARAARRTVAAPSGDGVTAPETPTRTIPRREVRTAESTRSAPDAHPVSTR